MAGVFPVWPVKVCCSCTDFFLNYASTPLAAENILSDIQTFPPPEWSQGCSQDFRDTEIVSIRNQMLDWKQ